MRIAILAPRGGAALRPELPGMVGGAELQLKALAGLLSGMGHEIDYLVEGDAASPIADPQARIWPLLPAGGPPLLKLIHPKGSHLMAYLRRESPDLVIQRGASDMTALGRICTSFFSIPFLFLTASDTDLIPGREILPHPQDWVLYRSSLSGHLKVVVQTGMQAKLLWRNYGLRGRVIPSLLTSRGGPVQTRPEKGPVLWGGTLRPVKRAEWVLSLARRYPEIPFLVFGGPAPGQKRYGERLAAELSSCPNIDYRGTVRPEDVPALVASSSLVLNSSEAEGFPNTFLEAWRQERPLLATVDPDDLLSRRGLGTFASGAEELARLLPRIWKGELPDLEAKVKRGKKFLDEKHGTEALQEQWSRAIQELLTAG